jgi:uncharacterized membrane protein HdeD (DUF308 family)
LPRHDAGQQQQAVVTSMLATAQRPAVYPHHPAEGVGMIILGVLLLILGFVLSIKILWTIGIIVLIIGLVLMVLGATGRAVGGRRHYW